MPTSNLGLTIPVGGTTPGALNNTTPGTFPYIIAEDLALIDAGAYSANNPPPGPGQVTTGTAPPVTGTWALGAFCWNTNPTAGGILGWSCVVAGTPGTWKAAGPISP